jgi:tryptophan 2,3-dioxygenase
VHHLRRINEIFKLAVDQFRVMETLTPGFPRFPASSPQRAADPFQLREIEILLS